MALTARTKAARGRHPLFRKILTKEKEIASIRTAITGGKVRGSALRALREDLRLTIDEIAAILGVSKRTILRKEHTNGILSPFEADRAYRLAHVADVAVEMIGEAEKATVWMTTPNTYLGGETPVAMLSTEIGTDLVLQSLYTIAYGGIA
jgi:putative toxin-antitoxin system antitoxin component (TIGR02293 family)